MKRIPWFLLALALISCQPGQSPPRNIVRIVDGQNILTLEAASNTPLGIMAEAGLTLSPADKIYTNGIEAPADAALPPGVNTTLQVRRAVDVTLLTPDGQTTFRSAAWTVGQAVAQTGLLLYESDFLSPPAQTLLDAPVTVTYRPARELTISLGGIAITVKSSALTVGQALAEAGIPLIGLDYSRPAESRPVPTNGRIKVVRVVESFSMQQKAIPFQIEYQTSDELELDTQNLLQAGEQGLAVTRVRVRTEDGEQVSAESEPETIVRSPVNQIVGTGTKPVVRPLPGVAGLQYWRAVRMYATSYSPCRSGVAGRCYTGTASGLPVKKGIVGMKRAWYNAMQGQQLYIPDYGVAVVADVGGGFPDGRAWIDLGYSDDDWQNWSGWVTVYFLTPIPPNILYVMQ